jgi:hypothetical protein
MLYGFTFPFSLFTIHYSPFSLKLKLYLKIIHGNFNITKKIIIMEEDENRLEPPDNSLMSDFRNLFKRFTGQEYLADERIEEQCKSYWKCPKCMEINNLIDLTCLKCDASRPHNHERPGLEELRKFLQKKIRAGILLLGVAAFIAAGGVLIMGYIFDGRRGTFPDLLTIAFTVVFAGIGILLIYTWLTHKVPGK